MTRGRHPYIEVDGKKSHALHVLQKRLCGGFQGEGKSLDDVGANWSDELCLIFQGREARERGQPPKEAKISNQPTVDPWETNAR